jgi:hypothetical protein
MIASPQDYVELDSMLGVDEERIVPTDRAADLGERAAGLARVRNLTTDEVSEYHLQPYGWQKVITEGE